MNKTKNPTRKSIRLKGYDYSLPGWYFITICIQNRECLFGDIKNGKIELNDVGLLVNKYWHKLIDKFNIQLNKYTIMPNHLHGIIRIVGAPPVGARSTMVTRSNRAGIKPASRAGIKPAPTTTTTTLGNIIGAFKSLTTHEYIQNVDNNHWPSFNKRLWQRGYYERIIRNEIEFKKIREYIQLNPQMWQRDRNNIKNQEV